MTLKNRKFESIDTATLYRLLHTAKNQYSSKEPENIRITHLVKAAGIAKGSFYTYFDQLSDLEKYLKEQEEEECWEHMLGYYSIMDRFTFSQRVTKAALYLMAYTRDNEEFRKITRGNVEWNARFSETGHSGSLYQDQLNDDLRAYTAARGISEEQARMNLHFLLTNAVHYAYDALEQNSPMTYERTREYIASVASELFPEI